MYDLVVANECRNTHHKLVMNSLKRLDCRAADDWLGLFVRYFELYLEGSKDPDTKFKDFRNHVIHVSDNYWGGAVKKAEEWYATTVEHLRNERWPDAVYSAGVLSHYYMDPIMPLHTGQTEEEGVIHRACEWSVNKSFSTLIERLESTTGYPTVNLPSGNGWLKGTVHQGADLAHSHYQAFIDHYNIELGSKDPPAGLDEHLQEVTAHLLGYASVGFARILEKAIDESSAKPAQKSTSLFAFLYQVTAPISWGFKTFCHVRNRGQVRKVAAEYRSTGKVINALSRDDKEIRKLHAEEILKIDLAELDKKEIGPVGSRSASASGQQAPARETRSTRQAKTSSQPTQGKRKIAFRLDLKSPLEQAPSIGPKTAKRCQDEGIITVGDFLACDPDETALALNTRHVSPNAIRQWQTQARLACQIPCIYGHDAQILAACGFETPDEVAGSQPEMVLSLVKEYARTEEAKFVLRNGRCPDIREVSNWVEWSRQSRQLEAA